jgi:hypothetical protein
MVASPPADSSAASEPVAATFPSEAAPALLATVTSARFPLNLSDTTFSQIDSQRVLTEPQELALHLQDITGYAERYRYIPVATFAPDSLSIAAVILYDYPEEWGAYLMLYATDGILRDFLPIYYDNAGGHSLTSSVILDPSRLVIRTLPFDAYDSTAEPRIDTVHIVDGFFAPADQGLTDTTIRIGTHAFQARLPRRYRRAYDVDRAFATVDRDNALTDTALLRTLWSESNEEYRHDTANGLTYLYATTAITDSIDALAVLYGGGCLELFLFTLDTRTREIRSRFPLSMTCGSDAEDYSRGLFLAPTVYERTATWILEYPEEGEQPDKMTVTHYEIENDGSVVDRLVFSR